VIYVSKQCPKCGCREAGDYFDHARSSGPQGGPYECMNPACRYKWRRGDEGVGDCFDLSLGLPSVRFTEPAERPPLGRGGAMNKEQEKAVGTMCFTTRGHESISVVVDESRISGTAILQLCKITDTSAQIRVLRASECTDDVEFLLTLTIDRRDMSELFHGVKEFAERLRSCDEPKE